MIRVQTKISDGLEVLQFFTMRKWDFRYDNYEKISKYLKGSDKKSWVCGWAISNSVNLHKIISSFSVDTNQVESVAYMTDTVLGGRIFCLKEPMSTMPKAKMQLKL